MKREDLVRTVTDTSRIWDVVVIGGGATGLGVALDATLCGFNVALFESDDFAICTSSRSTKLVHGGVRYLAEGDIRLVLEALYERGLLRENAPHLVKDQSFLIPNYRIWDNILYTVGLTVYDLLAGRLGFGRSRFVSRKKSLEYIPVLRTFGLKGGVVYHDGQFDDSRLAINLAQSCDEHGGCLVNYMKVVSLLHDKNGKVMGGEVMDQETNLRHKVYAKVVINATGVFVDEIIQMDIPTDRHLVRPSQGTHLVLDRSFLKSDYAIMIPKTDDGRVLFAVPWHDKVVVGTTDSLRDKLEVEPKPQDKEIDFILDMAGLYLARRPTRLDVLSAFAGLRPLAAPRKEGKSIKEISRSHRIIVSPNDLITIAGGKWTTYRRMAEDTVDKAIKMELLEERNCVTKGFHIHGFRPNPNFMDHLYVYGSDQGAIRELMEKESSTQERLSPKYAYTVAEVIWAVREEMARSVEDVLARKVRLLFLDVRVAVDVAPKVAATMAKELGRDQAWIDLQVRQFKGVASNYILA